MSVRDWFAAGLQLVTNQLSAMKLDQLKRFRRLLYSWFKFTRTRQVKVSYQATSIQKPVLDCLCPLRDCLLFTKDRLILVSIILAAAKTCGFSAGLVTGRSLVQCSVVYCTVVKCSVTDSIQKSIVPYIYLHRILLRSHSLGFCETSWIIRTAGGLRY